MPLPKRWPDPRAKWDPPKGWSEPGSRERLELDLLDSGTLMPGDFVEVGDGRVMQVVIRTKDGRLTLLDA